MSNEILTIIELEAYLKVPRPTLYKLAIQGRIPATKVGKHWRFVRLEIDEWLKRQSQSNVRTEAKYVLKEGHKMAKDIRYDHKSVEAKWQKYWESNKVYETHSLDEDTYYIMDMFPYPSGDGLHVGHPEGYTATDIIARYLRMRGKQILYPFGWDSFGLPAENYAVEKGVPPKVTTENNIRNFKRQIKSIGLSYNWSKEINTSAPSYYKWTQWLFLQLYKAGLAYRKVASANWCNLCQTVLANEQAQGNVCVRCGNPVVQKQLMQWFFRTTKYADELLDSLDFLDWPDSIKALQSNWINRKEGLEMYYPVKDMDGLVLPTFTTMPHTSFAVTFLVIAPEHPLVLELVRGTDYEAGAIDFIQECAKSSTQERMNATFEKKGYFTGKHAIEPTANREVPIWIANYAIYEYGTGIVKCSSHDERDFEFAKKHGIPLREAMKSVGEDTRHDLVNEAFTGEGIMVNSGPFTGMRSEKARQAVTEWLIAKGAAKKVVTYRLRDWGISRQRYWGVPIPIIYCDHCGEVPVPETDLPVLLPDDVDFTPRGVSPLGTSTTFAHAPCPKCGRMGHRELDTMDSFVCSSWYQFRYPDPLNSQSAFDGVLIDKVCPVDLYVGGAEHAVMHLLYARFVTKALRDLGLIHFDEPFAKLRNQGMIHGMSYTKRKYVAPDQVIARDGKYFDSQTGSEIIAASEQGEQKFKMKTNLYVPISRVKLQGNQAIDLNTGEELDVWEEKLSKSKKNVVNPDDIVREFGADTLRLFEMFMGPLEKPKVWTLDGVRGRRRLIDRTFRALHPSNLRIDDNADLEPVLWNTVSKVTVIIDFALAPYQEHPNIKFNLPIAYFDELINMAVSKGISQRQAEVFLKLFYPFAPHVSEELWSLYSHSHSLTYEVWPEVPDTAKISKEEMTLIVMINGKTRGTVTTTSIPSEEEAITLAREDQRVGKYLKDVKPHRIIYRPEQGVLSLVV